MARPPVELYIAPEDGAVTGIGALPEPVRDHRVDGCVGLVVLRRENATQHGTDAEHRHHTTADERRRGAHGFARACDVHTLIGPSFHSVPRGGVALDFEEFRWRDPKVEQASVR